MKKYLSIIFVLTLAVLLVSNDAQACAMCKETGEATAGFSGRGLNTGILYLMAIPYIAFTVLAYFWYKASKKQKEQQQRIVEVLKGKA